ncbi:ACP S-malonyltransferase [Paenibacillus kyungheensis]|uniref:[acyl-carrier-protein] S-malonyltransferase n=1 Tax=Paenibacillus kyungheensis TaxID=1452732 RepID=A0AAX3M7Z3_9BACL|nr:ACP S-malonyltransferase [Paenibacillus kyungheensis]WCT58027.1 ACP S-malonyltransferase [Paenibacillus kyungheensis]
MRKLALVFPGQGSQYIGMGKTLYEQYPIAKETFQEANKALGFDLTSLCFEGSPEQLQQTEFTQPAILTHSVAAYRVFMHEVGIRPHFIAGHSLGEFSALTCSGAISFADAVKIVNKRGQFMQESASLGTGGMSAISRVSAIDVERVCREISTEQELVTVSNYNSSTQTVIAGHIGAIEKAERKLTEIGADFIRLKVSAPFHCPLMKQASFQLEQELLQTPYSEIHVPVVANYNALPYPGVNRIVQALTMQMVEPIQWNATMQFLKNQDVNIVVELGPGTVLRNLMKKSFSSIHSFSYDREVDQTDLKELLSSDQLEYPCLVSRCLAIAVCTRNSNWDQEEYEEGVIKPYRQIQTMLAEIEAAAVEPTLEQKRAALNMLKLVFATKRTPLEEQQMRFSQLFEETNTGDMFADEVQLPMQTSFTS